MHTDLPCSITFLAVTSSTLMGADSAICYSFSNVLHWHVPITCPIPITPMGQRTGTGLWKLLKSIELLQTWTSLYGKETVPILYTRDLCCWNLCHNCGFVCFFQLSYWQVHHPDLSLSFGGFLHNREVFGRGLLSFFFFFFWKNNDLSLGYIWMLKQM